MKAVDMGRLIEKVTIYEDKFTVEFKSGLTVDVNEIRVEMSKALYENNNVGCLVSV